MEGRSCHQVSDRDCFLGVLRFFYQDEIEGFSHEALQFGQFLREVVIRILPLAFVILILLLNSDRVPDHSLAILLNFLPLYRDLDTTCTKRFDWS